MDSFLTVIEHYKEVLTNHLKKQASNPSDIRPKPKGKQLHGESSVKLECNIPWAWVAAQILDLVLEYPGGVTDMIVCAGLEERWRDKVSNRREFGHGSSLEDSRGSATKFTRLSSLSVHDLAVPSMIFQVRFVKCFNLKPRSSNEGNAKTLMFRFTDYGQETEATNGKTDTGNGCESNALFLDMLLHSRFKFLAHENMKPFLEDAQRVFRITQTKSVIHLPSVIGGDMERGHRLLPTEVMVPVLDVKSRFDTDMLQETFTGLLCDLYGDEVVHSGRFILKVLRC